MDGGLVTHQNDRALKSGTNSLITCLLSVLVLTENELLVIFLSMWDPASFRPSSLGVYHYVGPSLVWPD
jgi:hypothetical protein